MKPIKYSWRRGNRRGILLIEILLVLVILSVSLTLVIHSLAMSLKATVFSADYSNALIVLDNTMNDLFLEKRAGSAFDQSGADDQPFDNYQHQIRTKKVLGDVSREAGKISEVEVTVSWPSGAQQKEISATTLLLTAKN